MKKEQLFFLQMVGDYLNGEDTQEEDIDLSIVYRYASNHQLQCVFFQQCKKHIKSDALLANVKNDFYQILSTQSKRKHIIDKVVKSLSQRKIEFSLVKGYELEKLYHPNYARLMGDIDMIIHSSDVNKVDAILKELGFVCLRQAEDEWRYKLNELLIEVHTSMVHPHDGNEAQLRYFNALWDHGKNDGDYFKLDWNFHFCYLIQHLSGHMIYTGVGFRQFLDLAIVANNVPLDWECIEKELSKLQLWEFTKKCLSFCKMWFGFDCPFPCDEIDSAFYLKATEKVFLDGSFGSNNPENDICFAVGNKFYSNKSPIRSYISGWKSLLFPTYATLIQKNEYSFLVGRKFLTPVAWILRFVNKWVRNNDKKQVKQLVRPLADEDKVDSRLSYLHEWGL